MVPDAAPEWTQHHASPSWLLSQQSHLPLLIKGLGPGRETLGELSKWSYFRLGWKHHEKGTFSHCQSHSPGFWFLLFH